MFLNIIIYLCFLFAISTPVAVLAADAAEAGRNGLVASVRAWVAEQSGVAAERVEIPPLDGRLRVVDCPAGIRLDFPFPARNLVRARCDVPSWQVFVQVSVRPERRIYVAARDLAAGLVLAETDLTLRVSASSSGADEIEDRTLAVGRILKRPLNSGSVLLSRDLDDAVKVVRITAPIKAGTKLTPDNYRLETVSRALVPAGAAIGAAPAEGAKAVRDLLVGHIVLADELSEFRSVLVARQNLLAGQPVEASMFEMGQVSARDNTQRYYADLNGLEFGELARNLQGGEPLRQSDVRPAVLVRKGQVVLLTVGTAGGLQVTLRSEAQQDGRLGEAIQLRNPESGRVMSGIVTGKNTARGL
jgi:flagella basal body P-ring formation protein FlgA